MKKLLFVMLLIITASVFSADFPAIKTYEPIESKIVTSTPTDLPATGFYKYYFKDDGKFYKIDSAGVETEAGGSAGNEVSDTFIDGDLISGILTITHTYGTWYPSGFSIYNNNNKLIPFADELTITNNTITIDLSSFGTLTGTWRYYAGDAVSSAGGTTTFTGLTDTPSSYSGQAGKIAAVNTGETALEFIDMPSGGGGTPILTSISGEAFIYPKTGITNPFSNATNSPNITFDVDNYADTVALLSTSSNEPMQLPKFKTPVDTTSLKFGFIYTIETGNTWSSESVVWKGEFKKLSGDNVAWGSVTAFTIGTDTMPSSGSGVQTYEVTITLATLGLAVGDTVQMVFFVDNTSTLTPDVVFQSGDVKVVQ